MSLYVSPTFPNLFSAAWNVDEWIYPLADISDHQVTMRMDVKCQDGEVKRSK